MLAFSAHIYSNIPATSVVQKRGQESGFVFQPYDALKGSNKLSVSCPIGLAIELRPIHRRRLVDCSRSRFVSLTCSAALNPRCSSPGQAQTVTREASTITKPVREPTKSPQLEDGGSGFPPHNDDDDGGGGGGRGGGGWAGGFFFFGFLAFLGLLQDREGEEEG